MGLAGDRAAAKSTLGNACPPDGRMKYVAGSVTLDGNSLPLGQRWMNEFRFRDVSVIPPVRP